MATPDAVPEMIRKAFKLAQTERPGAVYLAVPEDVEKPRPRPVPGLCVVNTPRPDDPSPASCAGGGDPALGARNPIVLAGHGAARAAPPKQYADSPRWSGCL